jgi:hypothetical protein
VDARARTCLVAAALLLHGCANQQQRATAEGAGLGGVLGFGLCKLAGGRDGTCVAVGVAAAAAGALIARDYARRVEQRRAALRGHENDLDARLAWLRGLNQDSAKFNAELQARLDKRRGEVDDLKRRVAAGQGATPAVRQQREGLQQEVRALEQEVAAMEGRLREARRFRDGAAPRADAQRLAQMDAEIAALEKELVRSRAIAVAMARQNPTV